MATKEEIEEHHIWCNFFMRPREGCKMCDDLYKNYPSNGLAPGELVKKHFPQVVARTEFYAN